MSRAQAKQSIHDQAETDPIAWRPRQGQGSNDEAMHVIKASRGTPIFNRQLSVAVVCLHFTELEKMVASVLPTIRLRSR